MEATELLDGLRALGFVNGFAVGGDPAEIILWENEAKQPTNAAIAKAAPQGAYLREVEAVQNQRRQAYTLESDPLNFKWQETRDDADRTTWLAKKAEIQARYPEPTPPAK
jgi:hypothetical protein